MLVNLIMIAYNAMNILRYQYQEFSQYQNESVQEVRFVVGGQIQQQIFYAAFVENVEPHIKSNIVIKAIKQVIQQQGNEPAKCK